MAASWPSVQVTAAMGPLGASLLSSGPLAVGELERRPDGTIRNASRGYRWPPFEAGNVAGLKNGARSERTLRPIVDELLAGLHQLAPWCSAPVFIPTVEAWAWAEARAVLYRRWFDEHGLELDGEAPPKGLDMWDRAERRAMTLRAELGLSPSSLTRLLSGLSSIDVPAAQSGLEALRQAGAALRTAASQTPELAPAEVDG